MLLKDKITKYFLSINVEDYDWVQNSFNVSVNEVFSLKFFKEDLVRLKIDQTMSL